jgi:DNA-binding response OmpR family regulator
MEARTANRVLVIEDEPGIRRMVATVLRELGFETLTAPDAESARLLMHFAPPDVIIADVRLPDGDGVALSREAREQPELASVSIVLMSAYPEPKGHCANEFLAKPFDPDSLEAAVRRYIPAA